MIKKNVLASLASFLLTAPLIGSKDPKEAMLLASPHPDRIDQNRRIIVDPGTPPNRSPYRMRVHERAVRTYIVKKRKNRLHP